METLIALGKQRLSDVEDQMQELEDKYGHSSSLMENTRYKELEEEKYTLIKELSQAVKLQKSLVEE